MLAQPVGRDIAILGQMRPHVVERHALGRARQAHRDVAGQLLLRRVIDARKAPRRFLDHSWSENVVGTHRGA